MAEIIDFKTKKYKSTTLPLPEYEIELDQAEETFKHTYMAFAEVMDSLQHVSASEQLLLFETVGELVAAAEVSGYAHGAAYAKK